MKKISTLLLVGFVCIIQSCNSNDGDKKDAVDAANDANDKKDTTSMMSDDHKDSTTAAMGMPVNDDVADFAVKAANGGMAEVEMGKIAEQRGTSKAVKDFGAMMVKDHSKANDELKKLAAAKNITLPAVVGDDMQKHMDDLRKD